MCDPVSSCKLKIRSQIDNALKSLGLTDTAEYSVEYSAISAYGDFSSNVALVYSKYTDVSTHELSVLLAEKLKDDTLFDSVSVAQHGFINFVMVSDWYKQALSEALNMGKKFGNNYMPSDNAMIITVDDPKISKEDLSLFRNEAVTIALQAVLEMNGYSVIRKKADSAAVDHKCRTIVCAPAKYWDSGKVPSDLSDVSEHVVTSECFFQSSGSVWDERFVLLLNELKPQTPISVDNITPAKTIYDYAWVCSLLRSFDRDPGFSAKNSMVIPNIPQERLLTKNILLFPSVISKASLDLDPSGVLRYLSSLVSDLRSLRDEYGRSIGLNAAKSESLYHYVSLVKQVFRNGMNLFCDEPDEYL